MTHALNGCPRRRIRQPDELPPIPYFATLVGHEPFPCQRRQYAELLGRTVREAAEIPRGQDQTEYVLLGLLARVANPQLPRRIVYVVGGGGLVDRPVAVIRGWIDRIGALPALAHAFGAVAAFPMERPVGLGVLCEGHADDGEWRADPARPAVVVGTADMVGSRLLFSAYGGGRSRRAMDAGLLGHDVFFMLDESSLAPAIGELLRSVERLHGGPEIRVMTLSASGALGVESRDKRANGVGGSGRESVEGLRSAPDLSPEPERGVDRAAAGGNIVSRDTHSRLDPVVVESYAATSAAVPLPPVSVYLRGVPEGGEVPETWIGWRRDIADLVRAGPESAGAVLSFFRPHPRELTREQASCAKRVVAHALERRAGRGLPVVVASPDGEVYAAVVRDVEKLPSLAHATVLLPCEAGGRPAGGPADESGADAHADAGDSSDRIRYVVSQPGSDDLRGRDLPIWVGDAIELRVPVSVVEDDEEERCWVYALRWADPELVLGAGDVSWLGGSVQTLEEHGRRVAKASGRLGKALGLPGPLVAALVLAGQWHDAGKSRRVWQLAAGVPAGARALAKSRKGRLGAGWIAGYRHEFGSVGDAERGLAADAPYRDLILHLIAAHHGWGRPGFHELHFDPEDSLGANRARAARVAERYGRLAAEHGPWRLAWLEALIKAADAWVSSGRDQ